MAKKSTGLFVMSSVKPKKGRRNRKKRKRLAKTYKRTKNGVERRQLNKTKASKDALDGLKNIGKQI